MRLNPRGLKSIAKDTDAFTKYLLQLGIPPNQICLLLGKNANRENIDKALEVITQKQGRFYFFYSGYGLVSKKNFYLACANTDLKQLESTAYPISAFKQKLEKSKNESAMLFIDICHNKHKSTNLTLNKEVEVIGNLDTQIQKEIMDLKNNNNPIVLITSWSWKLDKGLPISNTQDLVIEKEKLQRLYKALGQPYPGNSVIDNIKQLYMYLGISYQRSDKENLLWIQHRLIQLEKAIRK